MSDNFPNTFRIGPVDYSVMNIDGLHDAGEELLGSVTYSDSIIRLDTNLSDSHKKNILIHEIMHAVIYEAGYDVLDEDFVRRTSNVMTRVLIDNDFAFMRNKSEGESN